MAKKLLVLLSLLLSACSASPATPSLSENIALEPTVSTASSTSAPLVVVNAPSVVPPQLGTDPNYFRDDFTAALDPKWLWVREDPKNWSLTALPGFLQINVQGGYVASNTNSNLLLRRAPEGNFEIETELSFNPDNNFQFAGLIIYASDKTFIQAGRGYCKTFECVGRGLYMNYYDKGVAAKPDFGQTNKGNQPILLRLSRQGTTYTFQASTDGKVWFIVGSHTSDLTPIAVGLVTGQRVKGSTQPAAFDYFEVRSLP